MRIRKMIALLLVGITCMLLTGCDSRENKYINLEIIEPGSLFGTDVFVDKNTGVMYFSYEYGL